jgi:hypothetical protein
MLIDDWLTQYDRDARLLQGKAPPAEYLADVASPLTQRFVLSPLVVESALDLGRPDAIERSRDLIFTPARMTWIEWRGRATGFADSARHGFLIRGAYHKGEFVHSHGSLVTGTTSYVFDVGTPHDKPLLCPFEHDFLSDGPILQDIPMLDARKFLARWGLEKLRDTLDLGRLGDFMAAVCAMIAAPRVTALVDHDLSQLNRARKNRGYPPYLSYQAVNINVDDYLQEKGGSRTATGDGVALHHVRAHLRMRLGKVEVVRPHWRGDPALGIVISRHRVRRAEDENGSWQGEPLPNPKRIPSI